jgi:hypothetical protein
MVDLLLFLKNTHVYVPWQWKCSLIVLLCTSFSHIDKLNLNQNKVRMEDLVHLELMGLALDLLREM